MSKLEIIAVLFGLANLTLIILRRIENYIFGIIMVSLYAWIFYHAHLYSDTLLQVFFFVIQIFGWVQWSRGKTDDGSIAVLRSSLKELTLAALATIAFAAALGAFMHTHTDASFPYNDASVAALSVTGQALMSWRRLENWYFWIAANAVAAPLYFVKHLYPTAALYLVFLVMAIIGLQSWRKQLTHQPATT